MTNLETERYVLPFNDEARFILCTKPDISLSILKISNALIISLCLCMIHVFRPFKTQQMIGISVARFIYIRLFVKKL